MPVLYTIGYEKTTIDAVLATLAEHRIEKVIDVRRNPISRKHGFSKQQFANYLNQHGISYEHHGDLGVPNELRQQLKHDHNLKS